LGGEKTSHLRFVAGSFEHATKAPNQPAIKAMANPTLKDFQILVLIGHPKEALSMFPSSNFLCQLIIS